VAYSYPVPENESERLEALTSYNILDTQPEDDFEELALLASEICQTPIALITLIDDTRQWFKAKVGVDIGMSETPREHAFCSHTIINIDDVMVVNDARVDARFANNPLVVNDPSVVFYAGVPLVTADGFPLGSLCVIDHKPKELTEKQLQSLRILAKQVLTQMELRKKLAALQLTNEVLLEANTFIQKFATTAAHDIKNPLSSILLTQQALQLRLTSEKDVKSLRLVDLSISSSKKLLTLIDEMLGYSTAPALLLSNQGCLQLNQLLKSVLGLLEIPHTINVNLPQQENTLVCSSVALEQIFLNLITNAVRYNDKQAGVIDISFTEEGNHYVFTVTDNGRGIAEKNLEKIFQKDVTLNVIDRFNKKGNGLGLYTVKALIEKLGGSIKAESKVGAGTSFIFTIKKNTSSAIDTAAA